MGLSKGFKQGRIICTPITAALVRLKLRVPAEKLVVLQLGQEITVEGE
jgi:DNA cross-link repair 1A protein